MVFHYSKVFSLVCTNKVIEELEKVLPCIGLTAADADGSGTHSRHLVDTSDVNSTSTAANELQKVTKLINFVVLIFAYTL